MFHKEICIVKNKGGDRRREWRRVKNFLTTSVCTRCTKLKKEKVNCILWSLKRLPGVTKAQNVWEIKTRLQGNSFPLSLPSSHLHFSLISFISFHFHVFQFLIHFVLPSVGVPSSLRYFFVLSVGAPWLIFCLWCFDCRHLLAVLVMLLSFLMQVHFYRLLVFPSHFGHFLLNFLT